MACSLTEQHEASRQSGFDLQMEHWFADLIPDHAQQILYLHHHSVAHVVLREA